MAWEGGSLSMLPLRSTQGWSCRKSLFRKCVQESARGCCQLQARLWLWRALVHVTLGTWDDILNQHGRENHWLAYFLKCHSLLHRFYITEGSQTRPLFTGFWYLIHTSFFWHLLKLGGGGRRGNFCAFSLAPPQLLHLGNIEHPEMPSIESGHWSI